MAMENKSKLTLIAIVIAIIVIVIVTYRSTRLENTYQTQIKSMAKSIIDELL